MTIEITIDTQNQVTVVALVGRWDAHTSAQIETQLMPLSQPNCRILLDLQGVSYLSSAGLRTLLLLYRSINDRQGHIALSGISERLHDVMSMTGFIHHFVLYDTVNEGIAALQP